MKLEDAIRAYPGRKIRGMHPTNKLRIPMICEIPAHTEDPLVFYIEPEGPEKPMTTLIPQDFDCDWNVIPEVERIVFEGVEFHNKLLPSVMDSIPRDGRPWKVICERRK